MDARVLCLLALAPLLAGCLDTACSGQPPVSARGVGLGTPSSGGDGGYPATVTITQEPGGPGLAGAGVVFFWGDETASGALQNGRAVVHVGAGGGGASASIDVGASGGPAPPTYTTTLPLRAGPDGTVTAKLPTNRIVGVVAAADGWTEEWVPALATGTSGQLAFTLPLYRERLSVDLQGSTDRVGASTGFAIGGNENTQWYPQDVQLGKEGGATAGYLARLVALDATLNWTNGATGFGDLALGAGPDHGHPVVFEDNSNDVAAGPRTQTLALEGTQPKESGIQGASHLLIGPATRSVQLGPNGIPYRMHLSLRMDRAQAFQQGCGASVDVHASSRASPAAGALLAAGLLGAALVARRKPEAL